MRRMLEERSMSEREAATGRGSRISTDPLAATRSQLPAKKTPWGYGGSNLWGPQLGRPSASGTHTYKAEPLRW